VQLPEGHVACGQSMLVAMNPLKIAILISGEITILSAVKDSDYQLAL